MIESSTESLVKSFGADSLFDIMHEWGKEFVDILLDHGSDLFPIDFDSVNKLVGRDGSSDSLIEIDKHFFEF